MLKIDYNTDGNRCLLTLKNPMAWICVFNCDICAAKEATYSKCIMLITFKFAFTSILTTSFCNDGWS